MKKNAARRAARQLRAQRSGSQLERRGKGRERADDVFFALGIKRRRSKADFAPTWRRWRDSNSRALLHAYRISRCLGNHSDKIRRRILSNARIRIHSHTLTSHHRSEQHQMRRKTVEKQVTVLISISEKSSKINGLRGQAEKQPTRFRII